MSSADPRRRGRLALALLLAALVIAEGRAASARKPALAVTVAQAGGTPAADRPVTIRGTVLGLEDAQLRVATAAGAQVITLVAPLVVIGATRASLGDIRPGTFIGTAARAQPDGTFRALEVRIFDESMRGTGEGHRPMEAAGTTMTNASVDALVQRAEGPLLTLKHKDGVTQVLVPPDAPIVQYVPGDRGLLVPGASVVVSRAVRAADGTVTASRLTVGVGGTRLPM
ncbi:MAG TPA: hypothetical protein VHO73_00395 [Methylomirabilota bacterium]|nr:hypothetical protein [Methylomirabilota bacterium]